MCLCNLSSDICNGTKIQLTYLHNHLLEGIILTGHVKGWRVILLQIIFIDDSDDNKMIIHHKQFPVALAYAMMIDKS
jgi:hypothetical protein